jgi:hypothetical protein
MVAKQVRTMAEKIAGLEATVEELRRVVKFLGDDEKKYRTMVESSNSIIINPPIRGAPGFGGRLVDGPGPMSYNVNEIFRRKN